MTTKAMAERLAALCDRVKLETPAGRILVPAAPVDVVETLSPLLADDERDDALWSGFAAVAGDAWRPLVEFAWEEPGTEARWSGLFLLDLAGAHFVALPVDADGSPERVVARLEPKSSRDIVASLLLDVAATNGEAYGFELFDAAPTRLSCAVDIPRVMWSEVFARWLDHRDGDQVWIDLAQWILRRMDQMDPPREPSERARQPQLPVTPGELTPVDELTAFAMTGVWPPPRDLLHSGGLTDDQKRFILDVYLDLTLTDGR